jgi:hypothetical protein
VHKIFPKYAQAHMPPAHWDRYSLARSSAHVCPQTVAAGDPSGVQMAGPMGGGGVHEVPAST